MKNTPKKPSKANQHIVSVCLLKQFSKNKKTISYEIESLKERCIFNKRDNKKDIAESACYRILSKDFNKCNNFPILRKNIMKPDNTEFCVRHIYSISPTYYREYLKTLKCVDLRDDYDIRYFLENHFEKLETEFGNLMKYWNDNEKNIDIEFFIDKYSSHIINFVISNELRGKHIYKGKKNAPQKNKKISNYENFDKLIFLAFISLNIEKIFKNLDYYEQMEILNAFEDLTDLEAKEKNDLFRKFIAKLNNLDNNKNLLLIKNDTNLNFILSDVSTSVFYNKNVAFEHILKIIGKENFKSLPTKITLMPMKNNLMAIIADTPFTKKYITLNDYNRVKKMNSVFYSTNNEWLIVYDILFKRNEIIDNFFLKKITSHKINSNFLTWYENLQQYESSNNETYGYSKINQQDYKDIYIIIKYLFNLEDLTKKLRPRECFELNIEGKLITNVEGTGIFAGKINPLAIALIVKDKFLFNKIIDLNQSKRDCLKKALTFEHIISDFNISYKQEQIVFYKNYFKISKIQESLIHAGYVNSYNFEGKILMDNIKKYIHNIE